MFSTSLSLPCRYAQNKDGFVFFSIMFFSLVFPSLHTKAIVLKNCPNLQPRMLLTVNENLKPLSVPVRVGQAVDVVGQAGRPKTITGFQTHSTPVLLAAGDRAELATEK